MPQRQRTVAVRVSDGERTLLDWYARELGCTKADLMREALEWVMDAARKRAADKVVADA